MGLLGNNSWGGAGGPGLFKTLWGPGGGGNGAPGSAPAQLTPFDQTQFNQVFQNALGRQPNQQEVAFLQPYIQNGTLNYQQAAQYLSSTPEALQSRLGQQQGQYQNLLTQNNGQILGQAADAANASFAQNGRQFSTGQGNSVIQAGQQLAASQSPMIANNYMAGQQGLNNAYSAQGQDALSRAYNLTDSNTAYQRGQAFYDRQSNDYQNQLRQRNTQGLQGQLLGAGLGIAGAYFGGPAGYAAGSSLGGLFGGGAGGSNPYDWRQSQPTDYSSPVRSW